MIYLTEPEQISLKNTAVTMGKFDGVHLGHQKLLTELKKAKKRGMTTVVFTFRTAPSMVLYHKGKQLVTAEEKRYLYEKSGVDVLIDYPADEAFFALSPEEFIQKILVDRLDTRLFISGPDFRFGAKRAGDVACLKEAGERFGFRVRVLEKERYEDRDISSTFIKEEMEKGNLETVRELQGHSYFFLTRARGREWIETFSEEKLLPKPGIYACEMKSEQQSQTVFCEVLDENRIKISQNEKKYWTDGRRCVIVFRYV